MKLSKMDSVNRIERMMNITENIVATFRATLIATLTIEESDFGDRSIRDVTMQAASEFDPTTFIRDIGTMEDLNDYLTNNVTVTVGYLQEMMNIMQGKLVDAITETANMNDVNPEDFIS